MKSTLSLRQAPRTLERAQFQRDLRRTIRVGWIILSGSMILSILTQPQPIKSWQWIASFAITLALIISTLLDLITESVLSFSVVAITLLALPLVFAGRSEQPWIAYGLLIIPAIIHATALENPRISLAIIYLLVLLQYTVSKLNLKSISDNADVQLLGSYFSTSWALLVGVGAVFIRQSYLKYYDAIEEAIVRIDEQQSVEATKVSKLNQRDHVNGKLHGTVLNSLIAIKNSPTLLRDHEMIRSYIQADLEALAPEKSSPIDTISKNILDLQNLSFQRDIEISFNSDLTVALEPIVAEVIQELIRELVLNTKKHSLATECRIILSMRMVPLDDDLETKLFKRQIVIGFEDNSPSVAQQRSVEATTEFNSISIARLLKNIEGEITHESDSQQLRQEITFTAPETPSTYLQHVSTLRRDSIKFLSKGYIFLTILYSGIALPGFLYVGIDRTVAVLLFLQILLASLTFILKKYQLTSAALGSLVAISIFPLLSFRELQCAEIQYLPWLFNAILGSAFFVTLYLTNGILKWIPIVLFFVSNLVIVERLPIDCRNLLDGSIPGIIIIALIAAGIALARKKNEMIRKKLISSIALSQTNTLIAQDLVSSERKIVIEEIEKFVSKLDSSEMNSNHLLTEIDFLIMKLRAFLLCSEYFDSDMIYALYRYSLLRIEAGYPTWIEINTNDFNVGISPRELESMFSTIAAETTNHPVKIEVSSGELVLLSVKVLTSVNQHPIALRNGRLKIQVVSEP